MVYVRSSDLNAIDYDEESATLWVQFHTGAKYEYYEVPKQIFDDLVAADSEGLSVGKTFNRLVKSAGYSYRRCFL